MTERSWMLTETAEDGWKHAAPTTGGKTFCGQVPTYPVDGDGDGDPTCAGCKYETAAAERKAEERRLNARLEGDATKFLESVADLQSQVMPSGDRLRAELDALRAEGGTPDGGQGVGTHG